MAIINARWDPMGSIVMDATMSRMRRRATTQSVTGASTLVVRIAVFITAKVHVIVRMLTSAIHTVKFSAKDNGTNVDAGNVG